MPEMLHCARQAEQYEFDSIWMAETRFTRDGLIPLVAIATAMTKLRLGTGISIRGIQSLSPSALLRSKNSRLGERSSASE